MSQEILLKKGEAESIAMEMRTASADAADRFSQTRTRLNELAESFRGAAATRFEGEYEQWDNGAKQVVDALNDLGDWLSRAAEAIEEVDTQLAGS